MDENKQNTVWLGLDVSTNCIGVCIFIDDGTERGQIVKLTQVTPKVSKKITGIQSLFEKKRIFRDTLLTELSNYRIDRVVIEEPLLLSNNANTVATLLRFNGMIADCIYEMFDIVPDFISSYDARYYSFPELLSVRTRSKSGELYPAKKVISEVKHGEITLFGAYPFDVDKKEIMMNCVNESYGDIDWKIDKKGEIKKENYDACDSLIAVLGHRNKEKWNAAKATIDGFEYDIVAGYVNYGVKIGDRHIEKHLQLPTGPAYQG